MNRTATSFRTQKSKRQNNTKIKTLTKKAPQRSISTKIKSPSFKSSTKSIVITPLSTVPSIFNTKTLSLKYKGFSTTNTTSTPKSKYLGWTNVPPNLHWNDISRVFKAQGFQVHCDIDPESPTYARIKFDNFNECSRALNAMNGFVSPLSSEPMQLKLGRSNRTEGTPDDTVNARLAIIDGPTNLAWTVVKDALQQYVPVLSTDQVQSSVYKIRFFTAKDYTWVLENLSSKLVNTTVGPQIVFNIRPWIMLRPEERTTAQVQLEADYLAQNPNLAKPKPSKDKNTMAPSDQVIM